MIRAEKEAMARAAEKLAAEKAAKRAAKMDQEAKIAAQKEAIRSVLIRLS